MTMDTSPQTPSHPPVGKSNLLAAAVLCVVMVLGAWQMLAGSRSIDFATVPWGWDSFWEGRSAQTLEKRLEQAMPARPGLIMVANAVRYWLTGGAGTKVRVGDDNWLFLAEELQVDPGAESRLEPRLALLADTQRALEARGIASVILLVPDKARVHADALDAHRAILVEERYSRALAGLRAGGVPVIDLLAEMQAARERDPALELYYRTDTHWNQAGAELAAKAVAAWSAGNAPLEGSDSFQIRREGEASERLGDLLALIGLDAAPAWLRPSGDMEIPVVLEAQPAAPADALDDLFGDTSVPVVLLGTSYSQRAAFGDFLQLHLSSDVLNVSKDGGRIAGAAEDYFADDAFREAPPQLVVWEVPERFLTLPMDEGQSEPAVLLPAP